MSHSVVFHIDDDGDAAPLLLGSAAATTTTANSTPELPPDARPFVAPLPSISQGTVPIFTTDERVFIPSERDIDDMIARGILPRPTEVLLCVMRTLPSRTSAWRTMRRQIEAAVSGPWHHPELVVSFGDAYFRLAVLQSTPSVQIWTLKSHAAFEHDRAHCARLPLALTPAQTWRAILHYESQLGKPFNTFGYYTYYTPGLRWLAGAGRENEASWTCAQLTTAILKTADPETYGALSSRTTTPSQLYACARQLGASTIGQ